MVELKYTLDKKMLRNGAEKHFMKCHWGWYLYSIITGLCFIGLGIYFAADMRAYEVLPYVLIICGVIVLLKKQFYLRKVVKGAFDGKPDEQDVHCKFSEDEIWMRSNHAEATAQWDAYYDAIILPQGILLYPQKSLHLWIPRETEILSGDWDELVRLTARISRKPSHLALQ